MLSLCVYSRGGGGTTWLTASNLVGGGSSLWSSATLQCILTSSARWEVRSDDNPELPLGSVQCILMMSGEKDNTKQKLPLPPSPVGFVCGSRCVCVWLCALLYIRDVSIYKRPCKSVSTLGSNCWWRWCRCSVWWSSAGSHGGSVCLPASPGCGLHQPASPPFDPVPTGRREEGSDKPASPPRPAPAGRAAPRTPLHEKKNTKRYQPSADQSTVVYFICSVMMNK